MDIYDNTYQTVAKYTENNPSDEYYRLLFKNPKKPKETFFEFPVCFTSITLQFNDRIQIINCFNEANFIYAFGRNPVSARFEGVVLISSQNPYLKNTYKLLTQIYFNKIRAYKVSDNLPYVWITGPGLNNQNTLLYGIAVNFTISLTAQTKALAPFSLDFIEVNPEIKSVKITSEITTKNTKGEIKWTQ